MAGGTRRSATPARRRLQAAPGRDRPRPLGSARPGPTRLGAAEPLHPPPPPGTRCPHSPAPAPAPAAAQLDSARLDSAPPAPAAPRRLHADTCGPARAAPPAAPPLAARCRAVNARPRPPRLHWPAAAQWRRGAEPIGWGGGALGHAPPCGCKRRTHEGGGATPPSLCLPH